MQSHVSSSDWRLRPVAGVRGDLSLQLLYTPYRGLGLFGKRRQQTPEQSCTNLHVVNNGFGVPSSTGEAASPFPVVIRNKDVTC